MAPNSHHLIQIYIVEYCIFRTINLDKNVNFVLQVQKMYTFILLKVSYLSAFFISTGVPNGEFPEILIAKCRTRFYCTWFFWWGVVVREINVSRAWDPVHAGDKALIYMKFSSYLLTLPLFAGVSRVRALSPAWTGTHARETLISRTHIFLPHDIPPTKNQVQ
jgi:hypothetical protein